MVSNVITLGAQMSEHVVDVLAPNAVDDAGFAPVPIEHFTDLFDLVRSPPDFVDKVRPVERADQHLGIIETELLGDIVTDLLRGRGGISANSDVGEDLFQRPQLAIFRAKVVTPHAHAMCLVNRDE